MSQQFCNTLEWEGLRADICIFYWKHCNAEEGIYWLRYEKHLQENHDKWTELGIAGFFHKRRIALKSASSKPGLLLNCSKVILCVFQQDKNTPEQRKLAACKIVGDYNEFAGREIFRGRSQKSHTHKHLSAHHLQQRKVGKDATHKPPRCVSDCLFKRDTMTLMMALYPTASMAELAHHPEIMLAFWGDAQNGAALMRRHECGTTF